MTARKALAKPDERPENNKRRRVGNDPVANTASFNDLNNDCLVQVLSFLPLKDMNTVACLNQRCREARSDDSLDQTRVGIIVCSRANRTTVTSFSNTLNAASHAFTPNHTHLKIMGLEKLPAVFLGGLVDPLVNVTTLELSLNPNEPPESTCIAWQPLYEIPQYLPNVRELDLNYVNFENSGCDLKDLSRRLRSLTRVAWVGGILHLEGFHFQAAGNLTELILDDCKFVFDVDLVDLHLDHVVLHLLSNDIPGVNSYILRNCQHLQRVSMKDATWSSSFTNEAETESVPQGMIMKMVRNHPSLRWLRSDLTAENVAILQQERPEIAFVTE